MVNYCGIEMKNPVIAASATPTIGPRNLRLLSKIGAGGAVTKSIVFPKTPEEGEEPKKWGINPRPRFMLLNKGLEYDPGITEQGGHFTLFRWGELYPTPDEYAEGIRELKKEIDMPIIASICGRAPSIGSWMVHPAAFTCPPPPFTRRAILPTSTWFFERRLKWVRTSVCLINIPTFTSVAMMVRSARPSESP